MLVGAGGWWVSGFGAVGAFGQGWQAAEGAQHDCCGWVVLFCGGLAREWLMLGRLLF